MNSVVQNDVEERLMNPDATVIFNKAELAKAIHEEADTGPGWNSLHNFHCQPHTGVVIQQVRLTPANRLRVS